MPDDLSIEQALARTTAHYQPIVDLNTGAVVGAEALVRFVGPDGALRSPAGIIEQIEQRPLELELLMSALFGAVARDFVPILDRHPGIYLGVNVPPVMIGGGELRHMMETCGLDRYVSRLVCELTERQALSDDGRAALATARGLGLRVAIDDFGTGQSGIKQLIGLGLDILKIDKSQVDGLMTDRTADRLLRGVVALASVLRVRTVAEGVETARQAFFLRAVGVDSGQGWLWSKAIPAAEFERLLVKGFPEQQNWSL